MGHTNKYRIAAWGRLIFLLVVFTGEYAYSQVTTPEDSLRRRSKGDRAQEIIVDTTQTLPEDALAEPYQLVDSSNSDQVLVGDSVVAGEKVSKRRLRLDGLRPPDPQVAVRRSLVLPGWGQVYNRSWWKVPIIYAGFGTLGYFIYANNRDYRYHRQAVFCFQEPQTYCPNDTFPNIYPELAGRSISNIISIRNFYRRNRDLLIIVSTLWYGLQAVDAYIEAHMQPFDVGDDLSMLVRPHFDMQPDYSRASGLSPTIGASLSIRLR